MSQFIFASSIRGISCLKHISERCFIKISTMKPSCIYQLIKQKLSIQYHRKQQTDIGFYFSIKRRFKFTFNDDYFYCTIDDNQ